MSKQPQMSRLSRRERQIMDVVYQLGSATAVDVENLIPDAPVNATVRKILRTLEEKGFVKHRREGKRFIYTPTIPTDKARTTALEHLLDTFFRGSAARAVVALLDQTDAALSEKEKKMIIDRIEESRKRGR
jgi:BlaI family penicillinase repressor